MDPNINFLASNANPEPIALKEVAAFLVKRYDLHEGLWDIVFEMQVGIGQFGSKPEDTLPGAMFRVSRVGLSRASLVGPLTVDASSINPPTK
jgi:hypothetical protein